MPLYTRLRAPVVIWIAILMHFGIGIPLIFSAHAGDSTGPNAVVVVFENHTIAGIAMVAAATIALIGTLRGSSNVFYLVGQQFLLMIGAIGVLVAIGQGQFADGTERSSTFIFTDQLPTLLIAAAHGIVTWSWLLDDDAAAYPTEATITAGPSTFTDEA